MEEEGRRAEGKERMEMNGRAEEGRKGGRERSKGFEKN